jgi:hypothetical protein
MKIKTPIIKSSVLDIAPWIKRTFEIKVPKDPLFGMLPW